MNDLDIHSSIAAAAAALEPGQQQLIREASEAYEELLGDLRRRHPTMTESELRDQLERECLATTSRAMTTLATRPPDQLAIPSTTRDLVEASVSANTRRAYASVWRRFDATGLEADDAGIAAYLTGLYEAGRSPATASMTVAALRFRGRHTGAVDPVGPLSERVLAGFRRQGADRGRGQVTGIRHEEARQVARQAGRGGLAGLQGCRPDSGGQ